MNIEDVAGDSLIVANLVKVHDALCAQSQA
jgi:hypothetical protein